MSTLETRIAETVKIHRAGATNSVQTLCMCDLTWRPHEEHDAHAYEALAPLIREVRAEAWETGYEIGGHDYIAAEDSGTGLSACRVNPYRSNDE